MLWFVIVSCSNLLCTTALADHRPALELQTELVFFGGWGKRRRRYFSWSSTLPLVYELTHCAVALSEKNTLSIFFFLSPPWRSFPLLGIGQSVTKLLSSLLPAFLGSFCVERTFPMRGVKICFCWQLASQAQFAPRDRMRDIWAVERVCKRRKVSSKKK